jgi:hypothetical protein
MAASDFDTLVTKVMSDDSFAASLAARPEQALRSAGIEPTGEMLDALKGVDVASIKQLATAFQEDRAAAG